MPSLPFTAGYQPGIEVEVHGCSEDAPDCGTITVHHVSRSPSRAACCETGVQRSSELGCSGATLTCMEG